MVCPHEQVEGGKLRASADIGRGVSFSQFCADIFYGWPLTVLMTD